MRALSLLVHCHVGRVVLSCSTATHQDKPVTLLLVITVPLTGRYLVKTVIVRDDVEYEMDDTDHELDGESANEDSDATPTGFRLIDVEILTMAISHM